MKNLALIPKKYYEKGIYKRKIIRYVIVTIFVISFLGFITSVINIMEKGWQNRIKIIDENLSQTESDYHKGYQYEYLKIKSQHRKEMYKKITNSIGESGIDMQVVYKHLESCLPENVIIDNLSITESTNNIKKVNVTGYTKTTEDVQKFIDSLERDQFFNNVKLNYAQFIKDNISYKIDLNVE